MRMRTSLLAAAGLVAVGLAATPANAADPVFTLTSPSAVGLRPHPGQGSDPQKSSVDFRVENATGADFQGPATYTIDLSPLKGVADVALTEGQSGRCTLKATTVTCEDHGGISSGEDWIGALDLTAAKGSTPGAIVDLKMTGSAQGATFKPTTTKVKIGGPDLVVEEASLKAKLTPGQTQPLPIVFANAGTEPVKGVALEFRTTHGMGLVEQYDNCASSEEGGDGRPGSKGWSTTVCTVDDVVMPGEVFEVASPLTLKAAPHAFNEGIVYAAHEAGSEPKSSQKPAKSSTGKKLEFQKRPAKAAPRSADLDPWNNWHDFDFSVKNTADLVAAATSVKGKAGETVKVELGFQNNGPAWIAYFRSGEDVALTDIVIPAGAKVTKAPKNCHATTAGGEDLDEQLGAPRYFCTTSHIIGENQKFVYPFELKIEKVVADATGSVTVGEWAGTDGTRPQTWDPNHANDKTAFVINAKGAAATPTPTSSTTAKPTPTASATPSATPSASPSASNAPKPQGGLASTGATTGPVLIGGAVFIAAGGALFLVFRRRAAGRA